MKKLMMVGMFVGICLIVACKEKPKPAAGPAVVSENPTAVVAELNDEKITDGDLTKEARARLQRLVMETYKIKNDVLNKMIDEKLIAAAAKNANMDVDDYLEKEVDKKVVQPTEDEGKKFYEMRKTQMGDKKFEDIKDDINKFLTEGRVTSARNALLSKLRAGAKIKINLEPPRVEVHVGKSPTKGPKDAKITIVEFSDFQCPHCAGAHATMEQLISEYDGKIRYAVKDFPLPFHKFAKKAHEAAHCAEDQGKYWEYTKELWSNQSALQDVKLKEYAKNAKLNTKKFDKCLDSGKFASMVDDNIAYGQSIGVTGTPAFFINGLTISGARPIADFKQIIDKELNK